MAKLNRLDVMFILKIFPSLISKVVINVEHTAVTHIILICIIIQLLNFYIKQVKIMF
jgi:hypothetical protein